MRHQRGAIRVMLLPAAYVVSIWTPPMAGPSSANRTYGISHAIDVPQANPATCTD